MNYVSNSVPAKKNVDVMIVEANARSEPSKLQIFASFPDPNLHEIGTKQVGKELRASLSVMTYDEKDPSCREFFISCFVPNKVP